MLPHARGHELGASDSESCGSEVQMKVDRSLNHRSNRKKKATAVKALVL